jgi:hypothetical protein
MARTTSWTSIRGYRISAVGPSRLLVSLSK